MTINKIILLVLFLFVSIFVSIRVFNSLNPYVGIGLFLFSIYLIYRYLKTL